MRCNCMESTKGQHVTKPTWESKDGRKDTRRHLLRDDVYPRVKGKCRVCGKDIPESRVTCSKECRLAARAIPWSWGEVVWLVKQRDKGVCCACGCDTMKLERVLNWTGRETCPPSGVYWRDKSIARWVLRQLGFTENIELWAAHHVNPVHTHGPAKSIDELITLCVPCHKAAHAGKKRKPEPTLFGDKT
jgi:hypothetical protein